MWPCVPVQESLEKSGVATARLTNAKLFDTAANYLRKAKDRRHQLEDEAIVCVLAYRHLCAAGFHSVFYSSSVNAWVAS